MEDYNAQLLLTDSSKKFSLIYLEGQNSERTFLQSVQINRLTPSQDVTSVVILRSRSGVLGSPTPTGTDVTDKVSNKSYGSNKAPNGKLSVLVSANTPQGFDAIGTGSVIDRKAGNFVFNPPIDIKGTEAHFIVQLNNAAVHNVNIQFSEDD